MNLIEPILVAIVGLLLVLDFDARALASATNERARQDIRARIVMWVVLVIALVSFAVLLGEAP